MAKISKILDKFDIILVFIDFIVVYCLFSPPVSEFPVSLPNGKFLIFAGSLLIRAD